MGPICPMIKVQIPKISSNTALVGHIYRHSGHIMMCARVIGCMCVGGGGGGFLWFTSSLSAEPADLLEIKMAGWYFNQDVY